MEVDLEELPDEYQPDLAWDAPVEATPLGEFTLDKGRKPIITGASTIFLGQVKGVVGGKITSRLVAAKYTNNCPSTAKCNVKQTPDSLAPECQLSDELGEEFKLAEAVKILHILPEVLFLSPPVEISEFTSPKVRSEVIQKYPQLEKTCRDQHGSARMMLQERVGLTIEDYFRDVHAKLGRMQFGTAAYASAARFALVSFVHVGIQLIKLLQKLHDGGLIHGDLHGGNAAFSSPTKSALQLDPTKADTVILLDLGFAEFFPEDLGEPEFRPPRGAFSPENLSPWHSAHYRIGRRDDIFRAVELVAFMFTNYGLLRAIQREATKKPEPVQVDGQIIEQYVSSFLPSLSTSFTQVVEEANANGDITTEEAFAAITKMHVTYFGEDARFPDDAYLPCCQAFGIDESDDNQIQRILNGLVDDVRGLRTPDTRPAYRSYIAQLEEVLNFIHSKYGSVDYPAEFGNPN